ncbi:MAG: LacI family DNA-binding transcriptional regulator [Rhodoferax sp.]|nr:LacI family DNA-binding transcriptional regulator [Rhodoferax sp.]MBP9930957.1 LacI family DNA-binding transcriptional regulator [Rhodoferax sp.]HQX59117.1 LacI family DNA-binding transcriptional regulator [Burkholderiaceae bacterium]HQZ06597.1 LacI family DNA-binding transcriptional regulator [Burkholderiaceae bacterium]HRA63517.1 LacI family DNA-binding transcriptional regulator [Burkholderiaceae bacterium]
MASVTSFDVARLAQVSQSAVSRAFTPGASVSDATRVKIEDAARKLGYRPNAIARTLITRRSRIIGVVMSYLENQFYPVVLEKLSQRLQRDGYHVLLFIADTRQTDAVLAEILQYQVDGMVMASTSMSSALALRCEEAGIPVVLFNRVSSGSENTSSVTTDNFQGGMLVGQYLARTGHRRVAYIAGLEDTSTNQQREQGLRDGLAESGQSVFARAVGNYDFEDAKAAARTLFSVKAAQRPDAVFVANDHMAIAVMDTLRIELGLRIPQDVSVVGFDNVKQSEWGSYQLSSVVQDADAMIEATVGLLMQELDGENQNRAVVLPTRLVLRASSAPRPTLKAAK